MRLRRPSRGLHQAGHRLHGCLLTGLLFAVSAHAATTQFKLSAGKLEVESKDPAIKVTLNGEELAIVSAATGEVRLKTGAHLFPPRAKGDSPRTEVLSIKKDDQVVVRVWALTSERPENPPDAPVPSRGELKRAVNEKASELVHLRTSLDERIWPIVSSGYTTTEAAKLLLAFFRGDGSSLGTEEPNPIDAQLQNDLSLLRKTRAEAFSLLSQMAREDAKSPVAPIVGTWEVTGVSGAGGIAADALEVYDPDPVGRKFVVTNDSAALLTGAGFWLFDVSYPGANRGEGRGIDFLVVVRSNTVYHALYVPDGKDGWKLRIRPMNKPRPATVDEDPHDGSFVLTLRRAK